jgi:hypothetical protein
MLSAGGVAQLSRLLPKLGSALRASEVTEDFGIPVSTLRYWKKTGRVIAFRAPQATSDFFPVIQFSWKTVAPWAERVIKAVGNDAPAVHFLCVPRKQLDSLSFAEALRKGGSDDVAERITMSAERLVSE